MVLHEALESLLLLPILLLYIGAIVIGKRQDLVIASIFFITTALIHMAATNLLFFPAEYGIARRVARVECGHPKDQRLW